MVEIFTMPCKQRKKTFDELLKKKSKITFNQKQYDDIFPADGITDTSKWDITLFILVITTMFGKRKHKRIQKLRNIRNEIFHNPNMEIPNKGFYKKWKELEQIFCYYGVDKKVIDDLKTCSLSQNTWRGMQIMIGVYYFSTRIFYIKNL